MGPLSGIRVVELAGVGPGPFCGMLLSDLGADIFRIDRMTSPIPFETDPTKDILNRGRRSVALDLKNPASLGLVLGLVEKADVLYEGFRPGVMERLGLGPDVCLARNPQLVYGRMTGWGQSGPLAPRAGHDINYIAVSGALSVIGRKGDRPVPPINLVGDYGGGGLLLAFGICAALVESRQSGKGQVVDAAMFEGASTLMAGTHALRAMGLWNDVRGTNALDTGAHHYEVYETSDGKYMAVGSGEPQFYRLMVAGLGLDQDKYDNHYDRSKWEPLKKEMAAVFRTKTRDEWCAIFDDVDACVTPVLTPDEAMHHPHAKARESFVQVDGLMQPAPAPRFSLTPGAVQGPPRRSGEGGEAMLREWGVNKKLITELAQSGALRAD